VGDALTAVEVARLAGRCGEAVETRANQLRSDLAEGSKPGLRRCNLMTELWQKGYSAYSGRREDCNRQPGEGAAPAIRGLSAFLQFTTTA
jgi:hypothetical protein